MVLQKIVAAWGETVDQCARHQTKAPMPLSGRDHKAVAGAELLPGVAQRIAKTAAFHVSRLNMRVVMQGADGTGGCEPKSHDHQIWMI